MKALVVVAALVTALAGVASAMDASQYSRTMDQVGEMHEAGRLAEADAFVSKILEEQGASLTPEQKRALEYELERSRRIREDYSTTESELIEILKNSIRDFTEEEFRKWEAEGRFDFKLIDGQKLYVGPSRANLFFRHPELNARKINYKESEWERFLWAEYQQVKREWQGSVQGTTLPRNFKSEMTITLKPNEVEAGKIVKCWMPFPQQAAEQSGVVSKKQWINSADDRVRESDAEMGGEVAALNEPYSNGLMFPGDPAGPASEVIACRCAEAYITE